MYLIAVIIILSLILLSYRKKDSRLPPGPSWELPIFGHMLFLGSHLGKSLLDLKKKHGPIISLKMGSFNVVVLVDAKLTKEAFAKPELCGKPKYGHFAVGTESKGLIHCEGPEAYEQRHFVLRTLKDFGFRSKTMEENIQREVFDLLQLFEKDEGKTVTIQHTFALSVVNSFRACLSGKRFAHGDKSLAQLEAAINKLFQLPTVFQTLAIFVPILSKLMPNLSGFNDGLQAYKTLYSFMEKEIEQTNELRAPKQPMNFTEAYLDKVEETTDKKSSFHAEKNFILKTFGDLFLGAIDTSSTTLEWTLAYLSQFLDKQRKLQKEILEVVGNSRVPSLADRPSMPYTEALISEVQRMSAIVSLGVPHSAMEDIILGSYLIPKGTMILPNLFGMSYDRDVWGDPELFRPERFIDAKTGQFKKSEHLIAFGTGKRVCPGESLARDQLFLYITSLFQKFNVNFVGSPPNLEGKFGFIIKPDPFQVVFTKAI